MVGEIEYSQTGDGFDWAVVFGGGRGFPVANGLGGDAEGAGELGLGVVEEGGADVAEFGVGHEKYSFGVMGAPSLSGIWPMGIVSPRLST